MYLVVILRLLDDPETMQSNGISETMQSIGMNVALLAYLPL